VELKGTFSSNKTGLDSISLQIVGWRQIRISGIGNTSADCGRSIKEAKLPAPIVPGCKPQCEKRMVNHSQSIWQHQPTQICDRTNDRNDKYVHSTL
jgi:hypothetical protein